MTETRYPSWKEQMDRRINEAAGELDRLVKQAPYFMSSTRHKTVNLGHIPENATPQEWRARINLFADHIQTTEENQSGLHNGVSEFIDIMTKDWRLLLEAYEVQGRMLSQLLDKLGMESDQVLMEYADQAFAEMKAKEEKVVEVQETTGAASLPW